MKSCLKNGLLKNSSTAWIAPSAQSMLCFRFMIAIGQKEIPQVHQGTQSLARYQVVI